jgi:hypothetical protein
MIRKRLIIGLALNYQIKNNIFNFLKLINFIFSSILKIDLKIISTQNDEKLLFFKNILINENKSYLFDFSNYHEMINQSNLMDDDILFAFNDTFGNGRKLGIGLFIFILVSLIMCIFSNTIKKIYCPIDEDEYGYWICPYFFIGKIVNLKNLNFTDWRLCSKKINKQIKLKLIYWLNNKWRSRLNATCSQKKIKYRVLIIERELINTLEFNQICKFSKKNLLRALNSFI